MNTLNLENFESLNPSQKKVVIESILNEFNTRFLSAKNSSERNGKIGGFAFLWISLYGKNKLTKAFVSYLKKNSTKIFENYRGSRKAWYFGSQSNLGYYDGLNEASKWLNSIGIDCVLCDEYD